MAKSKNQSDRRAEVLDDAPLPHAPEKDLGVVFLFACLAKRLEFCVEQIQPAFSDCVAYRKIGGRERKAPIEFESRSADFRDHCHQEDERENLCP